MIYLSQLILNPRSRRVQREIAQPYEMHRSLMRAFPDDLAPVSERVLFRVDEQPAVAGPALLVQSLHMPNWSWLAGDGAREYLLAPEQLPPTWRNLDYKPVDLDLAAGQVLAFRLLANPTFKTGGEKPTRQGILKEEDQRAWLERKGQTGGFRVLSVRTASYTMLHGGTLHKEGQSHTPHFLAVRFDGLLQVTDPAQLSETVRQGIGSAKGFGFGLLSLAPARA